MKNKTYSTSQVQIPYYIYFVTGYENTLVSKESLCEGFQ